MISSTGKKVFVLTLNCYTSEDQSKSEVTRSEFRLKITLRRESSYLSLPRTFQHVNEMEHQEEIFV